MCGSEPPLLLTRRTLDSFCAAWPGTCNRNSLRRYAQRRRLESIRDEVGWNSASEPTAQGKWVPIFFNEGIALDADEEGEQGPRQRCTFYGCRAAE